MSTYRIFALKYAGPLVSSGAFLMWLRDWDTIRKRNYYIWCLKGKMETVVVDAGVSPNLAKERDLSEYESPAVVLARLGVEADEVRHVVITHLHWDHMSGVELFPNATFYIQHKEYRFWMTNRVARRPPFQFVSDTPSLAYLSSLEGTSRLVLLKGDHEIIPGITCLLAPGHTVALQVVAVETLQGKAIVGSDCAHVFANYQEDWPSSLVVDLIGWMKTYEKLRKIVSKPELLFPGHDILMMENYPRVAKNVTRLV